MKKTKQILSIFLSLCIIVSCIAGFSVAAYAWKNVTHVTSANLILFELMRSANNNSGRSKITINVPYGSTNAMSYEIPTEYQDAIFSYPDAFRAGSMGPDFYPDMLTGQGYIHPYDKDNEIGSGQWISILCDSVNMLPKDSKERKEALSFTLGFMLHYCGDLFGHDFVNSFAGGTYPSLTEVGILDGEDDNLNILLSHSSEETYIDEQANWDSYKNAGYLDIAAPLRFVTETLVYDGNVNNGAAKIFDKYGSVTAMYRYLVNLRMRLYNKAEEWRSSVEPATSTLVKYLDEWIADLDSATYALAGCFDRMASRMVSESSQPKLTAIVAEELWAWADDYGKYVSPIPDIVIDGLGISDAFDQLGKTIINEIGLQYLVEDVKAWIKEQIESLAKSVLGLTGLSEKISDYSNRVHDPSIQLDHEQNPFMASNKGSNFSEFDSFVQRFAEEQSLLNDTNIDSILNGTDDGILDKLLDSGFEPFYNTLVMFKLILMGPDNYTDFIRTLSGVTQDQYQNNTAHLIATSLDVNVSTADTENAGSDSNIYVLVTDLNGNQIKKKLLDKSGYNDFERGYNDTYNVELGKSVRIDQINVKIVQESTGTANPEWSCENITITPKHAGVALTMPIGCGSRAVMTDGDVWDLNFHDRVGIVTQSLEGKEATKAAVQIHTADVIGAGTYAAVYLDVYKSGVCVKSILLDKNGNNYNDFEQNSTDTYICDLDHTDESTPSSTYYSGIPVDTLNFMLRLEGNNTAGEGWTVGYVKITAYNNDQPLSETEYKSEDHDINAGETLDLKLTGSFLTNLYQPVVLSYTTDVDDGPASYIMSLDDSGQYREGTSILWSDTDVRSSVFFRIFKGFSPDIRINDSIEICTNETFDMDILFEGKWNGIRKSRRDQVKNSTPMPEVNGSAAVSFINSSGDAVITLNKSVVNGEINLKDYSNADLVPGTYDVRVEYTASASDQQYSDAVTTIKNILTVKARPTYTVTLKVVNGFWNDGTAADRIVKLTGTDLTRYLKSTDIPAVGAMPSDNTYKAGSWNVTPTTSTPITDDTTFVYTYAAKSLNSPTVILSYTTVEYDGTEKKPAVTVMDDDTELAETDYSVSYSNNVNAGTNAKVTVSAAGDNYTFTAVTQNFTIIQRAITITAADQAVSTGGSIAEGVNQVRVTSGTLADGQSISAVTLTSSPTAEPTTTGTIMPGKAAIMSGDTDVTTNYNITYAPGTLTVTGDIQADDEFDKYIKEQKAAADTLAKDTNNVSEKSIIDRAKSAITDLEYDESKSLADNKAQVDAIIEQLKKDIAAYWTTVTYTVKFNSNGGTETAPETVGYGKTVSAPTVEKTGYNFVNWTLDGAEYDFTQPVTSNITLTANWEAVKYNVTFFVNDTKHSEQVVEHGKRVVFPEITVSAGMELFGWALDKELTIGFTAITPVTGNLELYAKEIPAAKVLINGVNKDSLDSALASLSGKNAFISLYEDQKLKSLIFPKSDTAIVVSGNGRALEFNGSASLAPKQKLALEDLTIKAENTKGNAQNITLTAAAGGLSLSDVILDGKNANIKGTKGNITLGDIDSSKCAQLNVTGSKKTALDIVGKVDATKVTGFGTLNVNGTLTINKTLTVNELYLADGAVLNIKSGAAVTIKNGISGTGTIHLASGFKPITINGKASGHITITADADVTLENQLIFKSKLTNLNDVFDISAVVPAVIDGEYEYGLYTKSGKVYLYAYKFAVNGTTYAVWADAMKAITNLKMKDAAYTFELLGDTDLGSTFTLPAKGKYAWLTIYGNGHTITFKSRTITLTADLMLRDITLNATANKGCTVKLNKFKLDIDESVKLTNCTQK